MLHENTQKLYDAFPSLYRGRYEFPSKALEECKPGDLESRLEAMDMQRGKSLIGERGIECGDGWFDLIFKLSKTIEELAHMAGLDPASEAWPKAIQVKQKCGAFRFYLKNATHLMEQAIDEAEIVASNTCELCGAPGKVWAPHKPDVQ